MFNISTLKHIKENLEDDKVVKKIIDDVNDITSSYFFNSLNTKGLDELIANYLKQKLKEADEEIKRLEAEFAKM